MLDSHATTALIALAMVLAILYTSIGWDAPASGLQNSGHKDGIYVSSDNILSITDVALNAVVALMVLSTVIGIGVSSSEVSMTMALSLSSLFILATVGVNISAAVVQRDKRGDALGIASVVMSGISLIPVVAMSASVVAAMAAKK